MSDSANKSVYFVDANSDPVVVRIDGKACFQNSGSLRDFVTEMRSRGKCRFLLDFQRCVGMDSTFLGVLAGTAIELRKTSSGGSLVVARAGARNLELMRNLGLHRLLTIENGEPLPEVDRCDTALTDKKCTEGESAELVLKAHENLVAADEANRAKFQDVIVFLRNRVEKK